MGLKLMLPLLSYGGQKLTQLQKELPQDNKTQDWQMRQVFANHILLQCLFHNSKELAKAKFKYVSRSMTCMYFLLLYHK